MHDRRRSDHHEHHPHHPFFYTFVVSLIMWIVLAFAIDKLHGQAPPHLHSPPNLLANMMGEPPGHATER
jgi:hypothetical protein